MQTVASLPLGGDDPEFLCGHCAEEVAEPPEFLVRTPLERRDDLLNYIMVKRGTEMARKASPSNKPATAVANTKMGPAEFFKLCMYIQVNAASLAGCKKTVDESAIAFSSTLGVSVHPLSIRKAQKATGVVWDIRQGPKKRLESLDAKAHELGYASVEAALATAIPIVAKRTTP